MCDLITIAGAAMTAGSMVMNNMAASKVEKARTGAMEAERIRQGGLRKEADALNLQSQDRYQDFGGQQEKKAADLAAYFKEQAAPLPQEAAPNDILPTSTSNIVVGEQGKQRGKVAAFGNQQNEALGNLRAFGDLMGGIGRLQGRDASQIGTIGGFMKGSQGVLPYELEAANNKGAGLRTFADILGGAGSLATGYGLQQGGYNLFGKELPVPTTGMGPTQMGAANNVVVNRFTGKAMNANPFLQY